MHAPQQAHAPFEDAARVKGGRRLVARGLSAFQSRSPGLHQKAISEIKLISKNVQRHMQSEKKTSFPMQLPRPHARKHGGKRDLGVQHPGQPHATPQVLPSPPLSKPPGCLSPCPPPTLPSLPGAHGIAPCPSSPLPCSPSSLWEIQWHSRQAAPTCCRLCSRPCTGAERLPRARARLQQQPGGSWKMRTSGAGGI